MLSSITPLGERGRHSRWGLTVCALIGGAALGGVLAGLLAGSIGAVLFAGKVGAGAVVGLAAALLLGAAFDVEAAGLSLPTVRRQVDEAWLRRYRGWVYGLGFGVQLGAGVVTIVVASAVYAMLLACLLSASPALGALIGGCFGALRGMSVLAAGRARDPRRLMALHAAVLRGRGPVWTATTVAQAVLAVAAVAMVAM